MKALPEKFQTRTITAKCDPEVTFTIKPINNQLRTYIQAFNLTKQIEGEDGKKLYYYNPGGGSYDRIGFALKTLEGIDMELEFEEVGIGNTKYSRVIDECMHRLPELLYDEIFAATFLSVELTQEEIDEADFTPPSSSETSNVPETSSRVPAQGVLCVSEPELSTEGSNTT